MGFVSNLIDKEKNKMRAIEKRSAEERGFRQILEKKATTIRRQAYADEYTKQIKKQAAEQARMRFQKPTPSQNSFNPVFERQRRESEARKKLNDLDRIFG